MLVLLALAKELILPLNIISGELDELLSSKKKKHTNGWVDAN